MNTKAAPGAWDATYNKAYLGDKFADATVSITTALTDHLTLISDLEIKVRVKDQRANAYAEIRLSAQEMRDLAALLQTAADRTDELEQMMLQMVEQAKAVAA